VRLDQIAHLLEIGHHVAQRRRREVREVALGQNAGTDRLGRVDVLADDRNQYVSMTGIHRPGL